MFRGPWSVVYGPWRILAAPLTGLPGCAHNCRGWRQNWLRGRSRRAAMSGKLPWEGGPRVAEYGLAWSRQNPAAVSYLVAPLASEPASQPAGEPVWWGGGGLGRHGR
jgi:hypothetical protein